MILKVLIPPYWFLSGQLLYTHELKLLERILQNRQIRWQNLVNVFVKCKELLDFRSMRLILQHVSLVFLGNCISNPNRECSGTVMLSCILGNRLFTSSLWLKKEHERVHHTMLDLHLICILSKHREAIRWSSLFCAIKRRKYAILAPMNRRRATDSG